MVTCNDNFVTNDPLHVWFCKTIEIASVLSILKICLPQIVRIVTLVAFVVVVYQDVIAAY